MFETLSDLLRFLVNAAHRTGAASEPEVRDALAFIDTLDASAAAKAGGSKAKSAAAGSHEL